MTESEYIYELLKQGNCNKKGWCNLINKQKKDKTALKNFLIKIDKRLLQNGLSVREIELILG